MKLEKYLTEAFSPIKLANKVRELKETGASLEDIPEIIKNLSRNGVIQPGHEEDLTMYWKNATVHIKYMRDIFEHILSDVKVKMGVKNKL
jgi:hypothetical protein